MQETLTPKTLKQDAYTKLVKWLSEGPLSRKLSYIINKKAFYSSLGHSSAPV